VRRLVLHLRHLSTIGLGERKTISSEVRKERYLYGTPFRTFDISGYFSLKDVPVPRPTSQHPPQSWLVGTCLIALTLSVLFFLHEHSLLATSGQAVEPQRAGSPTLVVTFRGGSIDDNILILYKFLFDRHRLPTRSIEMQRGEVLERRLMKENVLFKYYPNGFDDFLIRLNVGNSDVSRLRQPGAASDHLVPVFGPGAKIEVPAMNFETYKYFTTVRLEGHTLAEVVESKNLDRPFNNRTQAFETLNDDVLALTDIARLNPALDGTKIVDVAKGSVLFPADGFRAAVSLTLDEFRMIPFPALERANVFANPTSLAVPRSRLASQSAGPRVPTTSALLDTACNEPYESRLTPNLSAISYVVLPPDLFERTPRLAVVDYFPRLTPQQQVANDYRRKYIEYSAKGYLDGVDLRSLDAIHLTPDQASRIEAEKRDGIVSPWRYALFDHPEFETTVPKSLVATIVDHDSADDVDPRNEEHGFHVAALVAARCNGLGISGVVPNAIVASYDLNSLDPSAALNDLALTFYCSADSPCIVNASWDLPGGTEFDRQLADSGGLFLYVAAAGDAGKGAGHVLGDSCGEVPACHGGLANVVVVTSFDAATPNALDPHVNFGSSDALVSKVALAAPGVNILSAIGGNRYAVKTGTSQATAFVSGAAALLQAINPALSARQLKNRLLYTADIDHNFNGQVTFGVLNIRRAVEYQNEDLVYLGTSVPLRGALDYNRNPQSNNVHKQVHLYRDGGATQAGYFEVPAVRRITRIRDTNFYNVVYEAPDGRLIVERHVTFDLQSAPGTIPVSRLTDSFILDTCDPPQSLGPQSTQPILGHLAGCRHGSRPIDLREVTDLIVRADKGKA
jgi:hypothetical protein